MLVLHKSDSVAHARLQQWRTLIAWMRRSAPEFFAIKPPQGFETTGRRKPANNESGRPLYRDCGCSRTGDSDGERISTREPLKHFVGGVCNPGMGSVDLPDCLCCSPHQQVAVAYMFFCAKDQFGSHVSP
jgi:hypothetical protein